jgi:hypothetical protein
VALPLRRFFCLRRLSFIIGILRMSRDKTPSSLCGSIVYGECPNTTSTMSKLSPALKALISARFAMPDTVAAPMHIRSVYQTIEREAASKDVGLPSWLAISVGSGNITAMRQCKLIRRLHIDRCDDDNELASIPYGASSISELVFQRHEAGCVRSRIDARSRTQVHQLQWSAFKPSGRTSMR